MCATLRSMPESQELSRARLFRKRSESFTGKYIRFISQVNARNHSWHWWAMQFTVKNPLITSLCRDTFSFLLVAELARSGEEPLVVIADSMGLAVQVRHWGKREGVAVVISQTSDQPLKQALKNYTPSGTIRAFLKTLRLWAHSRRYWPKKDLANNYLVITTLTHPQSFPDDRGYRDAYFGELVDRASDSNMRPLILAQMLENPFTQIKKLERVKFSVPIVPVESCLTIWTLLLCLFQSLRLYFLPPRLQHPIEIDGMNLGPLVRLAVIDGRHSGDFFLDLRVYYAAAALASRVRVARCLYPYENRSWEKMLLLGLRNASPQTVISGYQHASVTRSHTNFFLGPEEALVMPLPDNILTTGKMTEQWLNRDGNYPPKFFKTACALRQSRSADLPQKPSSTPIHNVLAVLASDVAEHVGALNFLCQAFDGVGGYEVRIRPHPSVPLESALEIASVEEPLFFTASPGTLEEDLEWADVVLYASSTVGMEAAARGIPVIHMDLGDFLDADPMSGWNELRWPVDEPCKLNKTIQEIQDIPTQEFKDRQTKARRYVATYLQPVTSEGIRAFWES
jgi:surface carbohydrate biosynthesis protein (TIGR04326 family)